MSTIPADALPVPATPAARVLAPTRVRVQSIDVLRGLVIVLMVLDHVRDYFSEVRFLPTDLSQTDALLFMTRWITHLCAPTFIFLAGVSANLTSRRCETPELRRHLITRGLWIVALEFTFVQFGWSFNFDYEVGLIMQVMWAIGMSMIVLAALVHLPRRIVALIGLVMIFGHNLLDGIKPEALGAFAPLWSILHVRGPTGFSFVLYPLIPWIGVMALGFGVGGLFELAPARRRTLLLLAGVGCLTLFAVLRWFNGYGDPQPWSTQPTALFTFLSFINVHKYPPSLLYLLVTLGISLLLLALFEALQGWAMSVLRVFGAVPLFVYVLHIWLAHFAAGVVAWSMGFGPTVLTNLFLHMPEGWGFALPGVYLAWALILLALYPACRWFGALKQRRRDWWLAYL